MRPTAPNLVSAISRDLYDFKKALPRMSWNSENLYNTWQRTAPDGPLQRDGIFARDSQTLYQQRFKSRRFLAAYHLEGIVTIKEFERWYLPALLPAIHADHQKNLKNGRTLEKWIEGRETAGGRNRDTRDAEAKARMATTPAQSMIFLDVERRLDVLVFRACLASSVYQANQFVTKGHVRLNGQVIKNSSTRLNPGDMFTVDHRVIPFLNAAGSSQSTIRQDLESEEALKTAEDAEGSAAASDSPVEGSSSDVEVSSSETSDSVDHSESSVSEPPAESSPSSPPSTTPAPPKPKPESHFDLPKFAQASIFVPAYLLPNYLTCSCVYVRHPTARPGYSEIPSPYDAGGDVFALGWEWYKRKAPTMSKHRAARWWDPTRQKDRLSYPLPNKPKLLAGSS